MPDRPETHRPKGAPTRAQQRRDYEARRKVDPGLSEAKSIRSSARWQAVRSLALSRRPLCCECLRSGVRRAATEVHHRIPIREDASQAFALDNLMPLCIPCHRRIEGTGAGW